MIEHQKLLILWPGWPLHLHLSLAVIKRGGSAVVGDILLSRVTCPPVPRPQLDSTLVWQGQSFPLSTLIDSAADESFLDRGVVPQLGLDTVPLDSPLEANALNGQVLARVCERTVPVNLRVSGNHQERISFNITDCPGSPPGSGPSLVEAAQSLD